MNKIALGLLLLSSPIFSMQLDIIKSDINTIKNSNQALEKVFILKQLADKKSFDRVRILEESIFVPHQLGLIQVTHDKEGFCVHKDDRTYPIQKYHTDPVVRNINTEELQSFLAVGYLCINKMSNGEYTLKANNRINGGGPVLGTIAYWVTKVVCYAIPVAATATIVVGTGGVAAGAIGAAAGGASAGAATAAGGFIAGAAATSTAGAAIATTAGTVVIGTAATATAVGTGVGIAGATIAGAGLAAPAAIVTAAGVSAVGATGAAAAIGTTAATVGAIESLSLAVGAFFGMLPTP